MNNNNVILTGVPRSGTTLVCHLLNKIPDTVALHEPMQAHPSWHRPKLACRYVEQYFDYARKKITTDKTIVTKQLDGKIPSNTLSDKSVSIGKREGSGMSRAEITLDQVVSPHFLLIVKHPVFFTSILHLLIKKFRAYAVIRNPLSILSSWNSHEFNFSKGRAGIAEKHYPDLKKELDECEGVIQKQLKLLSWFFKRYEDFLPEQAIIRYEDIIHSHGKALSVITPQAFELNEPLESKNNNKVYDLEKMEELSQALLASEGHYWKYYNRTSVESLIKT